MKRRIAVSVPEELVFEAEQAVAVGRAPSLSDYVSSALRAKVHNDRLIEILDAMDRELGPPGRQAEAWARGALGL